MTDLPSRQIPTESHDILLLRREARGPVLAALTSELLSMTSCPNADTDMEKAVTLHLRN